VNLIDERKYLQDAIYDWASAVIADMGRTEPVVWLPNNGPRPVPPFIAISLTASGRPGQPWKSGIRNATPEDDGEQLIVHDVKKTLTMHGIGEETFDLLAALYDSIYVEKYRLMLAKKGLVIPSAEGIMDVTTEIDNVIESHAVFDFYVTYLRVVVDRPGIIEHTVITPSDLPMKARDS
jgi:hypothetical protein